MWTIINLIDFFSLSLCLHFTGTIDEKHIAGEYREESTREFSLHHRTFDSIIDRSEEFRVS